ncbi:MAG: cupin domain-containing protein [Deltaproteobacteria bacterium]
MTERALLPQFIREALEGEEAVEPTALSALLSFKAALQAPIASSPIASSPAAPGDRVLERLERTLSEPPHRYAPFFARTAELFDLSESAVIAQLARLKDPSSWTFAGLPGISSVRVEAGPSVQEAETLFVCFNPGTRFPLHRHVGPERVLVLEGSYEDSNGILHRAGELRDWPSDTEHSFRVGDEICIFASVVFGRRFSSWPMRALATVLGR